MKELYYARAAVVTAAKAYRLQAIDLVCIDYKNIEKLKAECIDGRDLGFTGKVRLNKRTLCVNGKV
jgi:citrate lyase subunit beta-like protein